jgi:glycosyltransferase involved in cell wall biosynthesis
MKILLIGEYSRLHNSLKEGLTALGHEVVLLSTGDYFKDYPSDIKLKRIYDSGLGKKLKVGLYKLFGIDITANSLRRQFFSHRSKLTGYDVVQLINESPLGATPAIEKEIITFLKEHNKKLFLLSCGTDFLSVSYALSDALPYSILQGLKDGSESSAKFKFILKYITAPYKDLHEFVFANVNGVIASDMDYYLPLKDHPKFLGLIPNPVNIDKLPPVSISVEPPLTIFMGINRANAHTKGIVYFEEALKLVSEKYADSIKIEVVENVPYAEYIKKYDNAHIVLDQVLGQDQGYNALEAMAKGKVVFTGAEKVFTDYYKLDTEVAINALPDAQRIAHQLERFITDPSLVATVGTNAREFVQKEHHFIRVAQTYLDTWHVN